jgi:hypothetical protein
LWLQGFQPCLDFRLSSSGVARCYYFKAFGWGVKNVIMMQKNHRSFFDETMSPKETNMNNPEQVQRSSGTNRTPQYHRNYVVVQPTTGLKGTLPSIPRVTLSLTRGYLYLIPSEFFKNVLFKNKSLIFYIPPHRIPITSFKPGYNFTAFL